MKAKTQGTTFLAKRSKTLQQGAACLSCTCHRWLGTQRSAPSATHFCPKAGNLWLFAFRKRYNVWKKTPQTTLEAIPSKARCTPRQFKHLHKIPKSLPGSVRHALKSVCGQGPAKLREPRAGLSGICSQIRDDDGTRDTPGWVVAEPLQAALDGPEVLTKL